MANWIFDRQIKEFIGADDPEYTREDAKIALINKSATATLENLLGRSLTKTAYTEYHNTKANYSRYADIYGSSTSGYGASYNEIRYALKNYPVDLTATFEVHFIPNGIVDGSTILASTEYYLDAEKGILILTKAVGSYPRALKVVYTAGYTSTVDTANDVVYSAIASPAQEQALANNIPADLAQAALWQAAHVYDKNKLSNINVRESRGQGATNSSRFVNIHAIAPEAMAVIAQHKRPFFRSV